MRNRLLASAGWEVVSIPFNAWAQLGSLQEKQVGPAGRRAGPAGRVAGRSSASPGSVVQSSNRTGTQRAHCLSLSLTPQEYLREHVLSKLGRR